MRLQTWMGMTTIRILRSRRESAGDKNDHPAPTRRMTTNKMVPLGLMAGTTKGVLLCEYRTERRGEEKREAEKQVENKHRKEVIGNGKSFRASRAANVLITKL